MHGASLAPTLLVGLGGQGCKIIARVADLTTNEQKKHISFVAMDTDVNELRALRHSCPEITTIQTSSRLTVGEYLYRDEYAREKEFPLHDLLNSKTPSEGAGQVRAISKLVADAAIRHGDLRPLNEAIDSLYRLNGDDLSQAIRVTIISTIAGGTGSGLVLPTAMYIRNYLINQLNQNASIIRGFFLLPEVMKSVVTGEKERANLYCNAYATIREIDAFTRRFYGTLDNRYDGLQLSLPRLGGTGRQELRHLPFDFCFLFGSENMSNQGMISKNDLLEHAASCIYAQSIGPTNSRQNSSEDNTLQDKVYHGGQSSYCGAGASRLKYPYRNVVKYVALSWAKESISNEWLELDCEYQDVVRRAARGQMAGVTAAIPAKGDIYTATVDQRARENSAFYRYLRNQSYTLDEDGLISTVPKSSACVTMFNRYLGEETFRNQRSLDMLRQKYEEHITIASQRDDLDNLPGAEEYKDALRYLRLYKSLVRDQAAEKGRQISRALFYYDKDPLKSKSVGLLENYIKDGEGHVLHPNAVRYVLYQIAEAFGTEINRWNAIALNSEEGWENFEKRDFKRRFDTSNNSEEGVETRKPEDVINMLQRDKPSEGILPIFNRGDKELPDEQQRKLLERNFNEYLANCDAYRDGYARLVVFKEGLAYVQRLLEAFDLFYNTLQKDIERTDAELERLENYYPIETDSPTRYVCATKVCLKKLNEKSGGEGGSTRLPGELRDRLYLDVRNYAMMAEDGRLDQALDTNKKQAGDEEYSLFDDEDSGSLVSKYFQSLFDDSIMGYYQFLVKSRCDLLLNMDILTAIEKEAEFVQGVSDADKKRQYTISVIDQAKKLSEPFIDSPRGEEPRILDSCCYSADLLVDASIERQALVQRALADYGGVKSSINKSEIVFFRSVYNLKACELPRFKPQIESKTFKRDPGNYFYAYQDRISQVDPDSSRTRTVTPHLHKNWHLLSCMPELNPDQQQKQEHDICRAFAFSLLQAQVTYLSHNRENSEFGYDLIHADGSTSRLYAGDGRVSEQLHLFFEALIVSPPLVRQLLDGCKQVLQEQARQRTTFADSRLQQQLEQFRLSEFDLGFSNSLFELPLFYKTSCPAALYFDVWGETLVDELFALLKDLVATCERSNEINTAYGHVLEREYRRFQGNFSKLEEAAKQPQGAFLAGVLHDELCDRILVRLAAELSSCGRQFAALSAEVADTQLQLQRQASTSPRV